MVPDISAAVGVAKGIPLLLRGLDRDRFEPFFACGWEADDAFTILPDIQALDIQIYRRHFVWWIPSPQRWGPGHLAAFFGTLRSRVHAVANIIKRHRIDVVYSNAVPFIEGALAARLTRTPHVWHLHECIAGNDDLRAYLPGSVSERMVTALSTAVITNSQFLSNSLRLPALLAKAHVIPNATQVPDVCPPESALPLRPVLAIGRERPLIGLIASIIPRKDPETFVRAARRVCDQRADAVFVVIGRDEGEHALHIKALVRTLDLEEQMRFLGVRSDIPALINDLDVLVLSSVQETFGMVLIEAMAAGKPVIATRSGGPEEIVEDGRTGFLVPVAEPVAMAQSILELIDSPQRARQMGLAGHARARAHFSEESHIARIQAVLLNACRSGGRN